MFPNTKPTLMLAAALVLAAGLLNPSATRAQTVRGFLVDESTGAGVDGAMVWLVPEGGSPLPARLTAATGAFFLAAPGPGRYRLEADRIGYERGTSGSFDVGQGTVEQRLLMTSSAFSLDGFTVEGDRRCMIGPEEGSTTSRLWSEARKALNATVLTEDEELLEFQLVRWQRDLEPRSLKVVSDQRQTRDVTSANPLRSMPAEQLHEGGYIQEAEDGGYRFYVPDAVVLLSNAFVNQHCFSAEVGEDEEEGLVGLGFRPAPRRLIPDVRGVLWMDAETAELSHLELEYTMVPFDVSTRDVGARVEFVGLPNGTWVVRRWWLRMPRVGLVRRAGLSGMEEVIDLAGIIEVGGEVADVQMRGTSLIDRLGQAAVLEGVVVDSSAVSGQASDRLAGAVVRVAGLEAVDTTDAAGRFSIEEVPAGIYSVAFDHPRLHSTAMDSPPVEVSLWPGETTDVVLSVPSAAATRDVLCSEQSSQAAMVTGRVVDPETGEGLSGASVEISWEFAPGLMDWTGVRRDFTTRLVVATDTRGAFYACDLPAPSNVRVQPTISGVVKEGFSIEVAKGDVVTRDIPGS